MVIFIDFALCKIRTLFYEFRYVVFGNSVSMTGCEVERLMQDLALRRSYVRRMKTTLGSVLSFLTMKLLVIRASTESFTVSKWVVVAIILFSKSLVSL